MGTTQFKWHHDMDDKRFKVMMLLTDVGEKDQYMTYALRSHTMLHPYERFLKNNLEVEYVQPYVGTLDIFKATGKAGDIFIFDSNGMHSGNRCKGKTRDVFIVEYTADNNNIWGGPVYEEIVEQCIASLNINPFAKLQAVTQNKWDLPPDQRGHGPTWSVSLLEIDEWLEK